MLSQDVVDSLFPPDLPEPDHWEHRYPPRDLPEGAQVTRFSPSPTGFLHIGGVYAATIDVDVARQSGGVYLVRLEDTDQARVTEGATAQFAEAFAYFSIGPDEDDQTGHYGPYLQSARSQVYLTYVRELMRQGPAYPCFATKQDLEEITDADVQAYQSDKADQQSVVAVQAGEQLSEYQALEGLLIPSGNNIAFTLANWDAGSVAGFVTKMNTQAKALGMAHSTFADAAGALAQTVSTPSDLVVLGMTAMKQPAFAQIVARTQATLPVAGIVFNVDYALGQSGIIGIKTGSGLNLGANFLFAASTNVGAFTVVMFGCVMGQPTLDSAFTAAKALIAAMQSQLRVSRVLSQYESVGSYELPWGGRSELLSTADVDLVEWPGTILKQTLRAPSLSISQPIPPGTSEGTLRIILGNYQLDVPLTTRSAMYPPGRFWRLTRI